MCILNHKFSSYITSAFSGGQAQKERKKVMQPAGHATLQSKWDAKTFPKIFQI